ncbi:MAG: AAA family ATPase [Candidatus Cloacimonetes bacterium]|nr:AAA family ATPase [Candidatus Cloacimonadota bacterium]
MQNVGKAPVEILQNVINLLKNQDKQEEENREDTEAAFQSNFVSYPVNSDIAQHITAFINHRSFRHYKLHNQDVLAITCLWKKHLQQIGRGSSWMVVCEHIHMDTCNVTYCLGYITSLLEREIISFDQPVSGDYYLNPLIIQSAGFTLSTNLIMLILGRNLKVELKQLLADTWKSDRDFLHDVKLMFDTCHKTFGEYGFHSRQHGTSLEPRLTIICLDLICQRINQSSEKLSIRKLIRSQELNKLQAQVLILVLYYQTSREERISENVLVSAMAQNPKDRQSILKLIDSSAKLMVNEIIGKNPLKFNSNENELFVRDATMEKISAAENTKKKLTLKGFLSNSPAFEVLATKQSLEELIISRHEKQILSLITNKCNNKQQASLDKWGFADSAITGRSGMVILFYGAPGTGKTFAAGAIANELDRQLIGLNVSQLRNRYFSESEKLVKQAFMQMREMSTGLKQAPVFLINEADQLIHNRVMGSDASDTTENTIQSIILEELESFTGILILTTNLETNMDDAFFRRFDLKLKFEMPDYASRRKLWALYLRQEISGAKELDTNLLAMEYCFSGAQIALVVKNACMEAITRKGKAQKLLLTDIIKYANLEKPWTKGLCKSIGF